MLIHVFLIFQFVLILLESVIYQLKSLLLQITPFSLTLVLLLYPIRAEDGDLELKKPPKPDEARFESLPDAVAESVEQAMEQKSSDKA